MDDYDNFFPSFEILEDNFQKYMQINIVLLRYFEHVPFYGLI